MTTFCWLCLGPEDEMFYDNRTGTSSLWMLYLFKVVSDLKKAHFISNLVYQWSWPVWQSRSIFIKNVIIYLKAFWHICIYKYVHPHLEHETFRKQTRCQLITELITVTKGNIHTRRSKWNSYEDVFITTNIKKYISKVSTNIPPSVWNWLMKLYMYITREDRMCKCTCKSNQIGYKWFPRFIRCVKHKKKVLYN